MPEIDKLIALSKRFGVTVGYLLGVEEEAARQAQAAPERQGPSEAEVLQQYLNSLPKRKTASKKWRVVCAVVLSIFFFCIFNYISELENRINNLNNNLSNMSYQISNVQHNITEISNDVSERIEEALNQEYGLLASWKMDLTALDYDNGTATVTLTAVLKNKVEDGSILSFYARLADGKYVTNLTEIWDVETGTYIADVVLPMDENELVYYLSTPDGTVCLAEDDHDLCYLAEGTGAQVWCYVFGSSYSQSHSKQGGIYGDIDLDVSAPWMFDKVFDKGVTMPQVKLWLVYNGSRVAELAPESRNDTTGVLDWYYQCEFTVDNEKIEGGPKEGDRFWVEYEVVFAEGPSANGVGDGYFAYNGSYWEPIYGAVEYNTVTVPSF